MANKPCLLADGLTVCLHPNRRPQQRPAHARGYAAASANVVNCLLSSGGTICYSETGCTVFRNYIASVLPTAQEVPGGWDGLHCKWGEIHCATAAQRELDLAEPWWEQLDDWAIKDGTQFDTRTGALSVCLTLWSRPA